ncbi:MATE family efflux transporter [Gracilinema caldarium]|uniref:MATE efflux family protein n=1 Tax=Gracilinema caldarium (strain ATCC 51460 / DSM 7334 / H1) TaxID=744872 RepID=F8F344_GRAC1|nr:MATE family efflux transporter [Gracilinema caldarium]AEJ20370.1 MATE efflux family protein [Gracilinema caldarium DSM 7334]
MAPLDIMLIGELFRWSNAIMKAQKSINPGSVGLPVLVLPIFLESLFRMLVSSIDTFMLSSYAQEAVAGVGMVSQYMFFIQLLFTIVCTGSGIVLAQYLGAERKEESGLIAQAGAVMVLMLALLVTVLVLAGSWPLLSLYPLEPKVRTYAWQYFTIFGGFGSAFIAFNMFQGTVLRTYGYTRDAMYISIIANLINVVGNALALYGWFGLPVTGVAGVAVSSVVSQIAAVIMTRYRIKKHQNIVFRSEGWRTVPASIYRKILEIGVPSAGEALSYNVGQIVIMAMVTTLGTYAMSAQVYAQTLVRFVFVAAMSIGNGAQIKTGYFVGAKQPEAAYKRVYLYQIAGTLISVSLVLLLNIFKRPLIGIFTHVKEIAVVTYNMLFVSFYVETGRSINLITIPALKGAGDVQFPVMVGIVSMWGLGVLGAWLLGLHFGLGMVGIWLAVGTDETIRGIIMLFRWKSKRWMTKAIV